ncbi:MAG: hypothetical protein K0Q95_2651 [Bacteroidota bacterium]|jgi:hypothetical protein|nr:hypothetical protein [Bacteroidota bacterium]
MAANKHIQMKFICNQEWDDMKASANGRFCDSCKHEVFDFTNTSLGQIHAIKAKGEKVCGHFRIEQTEDIKLIEFRIFKKARYWLAALGTYLVLETAKAQTTCRQLVRTEITGRNCVETVRIQLRQILLKRL